MEKIKSKKEWHMATKPLKNCSEIAAPEIRLNKSYKNFFNSMPRSFLLRLDFQ
jgi:hypothetical protein